MIKDTIAHIETQLADFYSASECRELAWWIMEECTKQNRSQLLLDCKGTKNIPNLENILHRLQKKEPIEYIFGHCLWNGLDLQLDESTLIPRPETAELCTLVNQHCGHYRNLRILDIATGSGCIAIWLKQQHPEWDVYGLDISKQALSIAQQNASLNHVNVNFSEADILTDDIEDYDVIVSNPPYVRELEKKDMDSRVIDYEPHIALFVPDSNPLLFYERIAKLKKAKWIFFEINEALGHEMIDLMEKYGYQDIQIRQDQYEKPRMLSARIEK